MVFNPLQKNFRQDSVVVSYTYTLIFKYIIVSFQKYSEFYIEKSSLPEPYRKSLKHLKSPRPMAIKFSDTTLGLTQKLGRVLIKSGYPTIYF